MPKTIIINEEIANELKDMLTMTQFKFKANIKKFLASLLEDPTGAEPDMIFTKNGLDKNKLIKALVDNKVITKKMTIDDHDAEGNPHTAKMIVKYSVPKERFNEKLDALYDMLFPDVDARINEDITRDELQIIKNSPLTIGVINQTNPNSLNGMIADMAAEEYNKKAKNKKELDEEGAAGGGATSCSGVDGNGFGSGEFVQPLFGGISVRKKKKDKKNVGGNPYTLNENQESKSIDAAKRLYMQRTGRSADEADKFIRVDLRNDIPVLRDRNGAKFILGVTRMFLDGQLRDARTIQNLNKTLKLLTQGHFNEYDRNLNGMSAQDLIQRFSTTMKQMDDQEREELGNMQFTDNNGYQIVRIDDFEQASQYGQYTSWCVTHYENMLNSYTSNGLGQFYFCLRNGFENEPAEPGEGCPLDSYGLSMIAVSVDENGRLNTCTCRWNHDNGGNDNIMDAKQISQVIGRNFFDVFKPNGRWQEIVGNAMERLANGESPEDVFDWCGNFSEGLARVKLNGKANWIRKDNGKFFSDQWYDWCCNFDGGLAVVDLNGKYNWVRRDNGQLLSNQGFDDCGIFHEGLAVVELNNRRNWVRADNGQLFSDQWFDECSEFSEGLARVKLNGKANWVRADNGQLLSNQWFDECSEFSEGLAKVRLNGYANWVRQDNGQLLSDQWFDDCGDCHEGLARVRLNGGCNWVRQDNGQLLSDKWYDVCYDFHEGFAEVELKGKDNWVRADNGQLLCSQWYDVCGDFIGGLARVDLNGKENWVRADNGQLFSDQWFDTCCDFHEGFAEVELKGKLYLMRKDGVLCDDKTEEPIQRQSELNEMVNCIVRSILSEAVTGEDADKAAAIYAYCLDDEEEDYCILCAKRIEGDEKGKWNPPMGHLHVGESPKDGAVRECEEESGVKIPKSKLQVGSYEDWGRNYWVILDGTIKDWPVGKGDGENTKFEWKNVYGLFYGKDKDLEWAWNTKDFIYQFAPAELDLD